MTFNNDDIQMWDFHVEDCSFVENVQHFQGSNSQSQCENDAYSCGGEKKPVNGMFEQAYLPYNIENKNIGEPWSQSKTCRVQEFDCARDPDNKNVLSELSNWLCHDGPSLRSFPSQEVLDQSFGVWLSSCLTDDMDASGLTNVTNKEIGMQNLRQIRESTTLLKRPNIPIRHNSNFQEKQIHARASDASSSKSIASPFTFLKPRGFIMEEVTLKDINQGIHSPPKKHKDLVEYSAFSGKLVVAKTKIWTQGQKGSITILRTKG